MEKPIILTKQNVFFTSDTHYSHTNIVRGESKWIKEEINKDHAGLRDFDTVKNMNDALVNGINSSVKEDDILFHLGDWSFGGIENIYDFRKRLNCKNIFLCFGNHDHHIVSNKPLIDKETSDYVFQENSSLKYIMNAQDLFVSASQILEIKVQKTTKSKSDRFFLSHYSHRVWNKHHHGSYHLFGHSHGSLDHLMNGRSMDVGIDCAKKYYGEYRPFHINEIFDILDGRKIQQIDHHQ